MIILITGLIFKYCCCFSLIDNSIELFIGMLACAAHILSYLINWLDTRLGGIHKNMMDRLFSEVHLRNLLTNNKNR